MCFELLRYRTGLQPRGGWRWWWGHSPLLNSPPSYCSLSCSGSITSSQSEASFRTLPLARPPSGQRLGSSKDKRFSHARTHTHTGPTPQQWEGTILQLHDDSFQHRHHGGDVQQDQDDWLQNTFKLFRAGSRHHVG